MVEFHRQDHKADLAAWKPVLKQIRRLITLGVNAGKPWDGATTVGEVAKTCGLEPAEIARLIKECGWLVFVVEDPSTPLDTWIVFEDGE